jgi:hypothetical protein
MEHVEAMHVDDRRMHRCISEIHQIPAFLDEIRRLTKIKTNALLSSRAFSHESAEISPTITLFCLVVHSRLPGWRVFQVLLFVVPPRHNSQLYFRQIALSSLRKSF